MDLEVGPMRITRWLCDHCTFDRMAGKSSIVRELGSLVRLLTPGRGTVVIMKVGMWGRGALLARCVPSLPLLGVPAAPMLPTTAGVEVTEPDLIYYR